MDVDLKVQDVQEASELMVIENIEKDININKRKLFDLIKRSIDILAGLVGTMLLIPITIGIYIVHKITKDVGPIFYKQYRIGKNGKPFIMYKYRTMIVNADEELEKYLSENEDMKEEYGTYKKLKNDPRITKIGKFLRKTSIDEMPQFINILKGEMTLVGPRPYLLKEKEEMNGYFKYITSLTPGLTGFWQISGRNNVTFNDRLEMDMQYFFKHNLKLDAKLLLKTAKVVMKKEGAR